MKLKDKFVKVILGVGGLLAGISLLVGVVSAIPGKRAYFNYSESQSRFIRLEENPNVQSKFVAKYDNLSQLEILFKNPNLESQDELSISLSDEFEKKIIKKRFSGFNFGDTSRGRLDFEPIANSKGKTYYVNIEDVEIKDGKLAYAIKDGGLDIAEYYKSGSLFGNSLSGVSNYWNKIINQQLVVILIPMALVIVWALW